MLVNGDCLEEVQKLVDKGVQVDSIVTDPPYHLTSIVERFGKEGSAPAKDKDGAFQRQSVGFMGKEWDGGDIAFRKETWELFMKVLKPGGHLLAFSGSRTYHRMAVAIEDAGFDIRDQIMWLYGSGFPKSLNLGKSVDKKLGNERIKTGETKIHAVISLSQVSLSIFSDFSISTSCGIALSSFRIGFSGGLFSTFLTKLFGNTPTLFPSLPFHQPWST